MSLEQANRAEIREIVRVSDNPQTKPSPDLRRAKNRKRSAAAKIARKKNRGR